MNNDKPASIPETLKNILVTGATGAMGSVICPYLHDLGYKIRGFARHMTESKDYFDSFVTGHLDQADRVHKALEGMDAVIHLAAYPNPADFIDVLLKPNVIGLYHVCEISRKLGIKRLILSSSVQAIGEHYRKGLKAPVKVSDGPAPGNFYGLTKAWAEVTGQMFAWHYGMSVITVRIGWFPRNIDEANHLASCEQGPNHYLSHHDTQRFYARCLQSENPGNGEHVLCFLTSRPKTNPQVDLKESRELLGYEPSDIWPNGLTFKWAGGSQ